MAEIKLDVEKVIEHFGGITPLHERFSREGIKISRKAIEKWKERDSIPTGGWLHIEAMAEAEGSLSALRNEAIGREENKTSRPEIAVNTYSKEQLLEFYHQMLYIRRFEEKAGQLYGMGMIGGFCHLYIGQEAVAIGLVAAKKKGDAIITSYRDHGLMLAAGSRPHMVMAELMGRIPGCSKGKGGSMHMFDLENHFYGGHGIVGAPVPLGTGIAFANKYRGNDNVCLTFFGDGAVNQGQVYESFNIASLWQLPVLYVIENNEYAMGTSVERSSASPDLCNRGEALGIAGRQVDGMNVLSVYEAGKEALAYIRTRQRPFILEMKTYRYRGHSMSDPAKYRSKEEVNAMKEKHDPIESLKKQLVEKQNVQEEVLKNMDKDIRDKINEVVESCKKSPEPDAKELWTDIFTVQLSDKGGV